MDGFQEVDGANMAYDDQRDGVWLSDQNGDPVLFLPRNTLIQALSLLTGNSPVHRVGE